MLDCTQLHQCLSPLWQCDTIVYPTLTKAQEEGAKVGQQPLCCVLCLSGPADASLPVGAHHISKEIPA